MATPVQVLMRGAMAAGAVIAVSVVTPPLPSAASCAGPLLAVGDGVPTFPPSTAAAPIVRRGEQLVVSGRWFKDGCADTIAHTTGCAAQPTQPTTEIERPLTGVSLTFRSGQSAREQELGVADAGTGPDFAIRWAARIPKDAPIGPGTLTAADTTLRITIQT